MDTAIKQRILGGVVLLAGAAIFLPLMLDGTGARLLSRLQPIPAQPVVPSAEKAAPNLDTQAGAAEQAVDAAHEDATEFFPVGEPVSPDAAPVTSGIPSAAPPGALAKTPEQLAAEEAARQRALDLLRSTDEISPEEAAQQQREASRLAREMASRGDGVTAAVPVPDARKAEEERARAILEGRQAQEQKAAEEAARAERLRAEADAAKARELKLAQEKAMADKSRPAEEQLRAERKLAEDKLKADKLAAEKKAAEKKAADKRLADEKAQAEKVKADRQAAEDKAKADRLAAEKKAAEEKARKLEEQKKAQAALDGKAKTTDKDKAPGGQAWVVQAGSFSDKAKASELAGKLKGKGYRAQVVKSGEAWKVVVGPELDKEAARSLSGRLNGEAGVSGAWVAPWKP